MNSYWVIALMFGITIGLYLVGFKSDFMNYMDSKTPEQVIDIAGLIKSYVTDWNNLFFISAAVVTGAVMGGLNLLVIIPFVLASILLKFFFFPLNYADIVNAGMPVEIALPISLFFTVTMFLGIIAFLRG